MTTRAAIVTGASSGIGLAIARVLAQEGHAVTMHGRREEKLDAAVRSLAAEGFEVSSVAGNVAEEDAVRELVAAHERRYGRLDVLVNNAGVGMGQAAGEIVTRHLDTQLAVNLRALILCYREAMPLLERAGTQDGALVINTASITGKRGVPWLSVYSATKHGIVGYTESMNKELATRGIRSCALCPAFVDTAMTDFIKGEVAPAEMITAADVAEGVRFLLRLSHRCVVPEIIFERPGAET
ncbi:MAG TPA: SDR family oxidoreductase [Solirubrobacteraceae bacterium]|jgi:NAD(P)-dependent dehydrogenase (short-subunit alcohol dehydrogenase family)|nr:SDR family oxidoreductase [Solirubrobacteraceae bacterium]